MRVAKIQAAKPHSFGIAPAAAGPIHLQNRPPDEFRTVRDLIERKVKLCSRRWIEHPRSEGGTRSPLRVAKIQAAKPQLFGIVRRSGRSTFKNRPPEEFRAVRDLIGSKVKTLLATLE